MGPARVRRPRDRQEARPARLPRPDDPRGRRLRRRRLAADRHQDVHHQRQLGGGRVGLCAHRRPRAARRHRVPGADRRAGRDPQGDPRQARSARPADGRAGLRRGTVARRDPPRAGGRRVPHRDVHLGQGPDVARGGMRRHRAGLPRRGRPVRGGAAAVRQADRRAPAGAAAARPDRGRHRRGAAAGVAGRRPGRPGPAVRHGGVDGKAVRERDRGPRGQRRAAGLRRVRVRRRVPGRQVPARRPGVHTVRGHQPDSAAAHRPGADGVSAF